MSRILVVHADSKVREVVGAILEKGGHRVRTTQDGPSALKVFLQDRPDIVILDDELKTPASFQVFSEIKKIEPLAKVLVFAMRTDREKRETRMRFGIRAFQPGEVIQIVEELQTPGEKTSSRPDRFAPRVLVVDDDAGVLNTIRRFLSEKGYEVATAANGMDALPLLKKLRPLLVLLDVDMPKMNGVETLKRIRELDGQVGVMMITGDATVETMAQCQELGAYDYLVKPIDFQYLEFSVYSKVLLMTL